MLLQDMLSKNLQHGGFRKFRYLVINFVLAMGYLGSLWISGVGLGLGWTRDGLFVELTKIVLPTCCQ